MRFQKVDPARESKEQLSGSDADISRHMKELDTLKEGAGAVAKLIACGHSAIEPLRKFLLAGEPRVLYHTRRWAVEALAGLGARDILLEYLKQEREIPDLAVRLGEEAVKSAAAQKLIKWPSEEVIQVLIGIAQERSLPGALEALGELKRPEAIPFLIEALEDDVCRPVAEDALRKIGRPAESALIQATITSYPNRESEKPSSLLRRRCAVGLLEELGVSKNKWALLRPLLQDVDDKILTAVFKIAVSVAGVKDRETAFRRLIEILQNADWYVKGEIENALIDEFEAIKKTMEEEIHRRRKRLKGDLDSVLICLLDVRRRTDQEKLDFPGGHFDR